MDLGLRNAVPKLDRLGCRSQVLGVEGKKLSTQVGIDLGIIYLPVFYGYKYRHL